MRTGQHAPGPGRPSGGRFRGENGAGGAPRATIPGHLPRTGRETRLVQPFPRHFDNPPGASDIIGIHQCARLFDADARPALTPGELDAIARLVDAGFDPSCCLISGPPASTTGPTRVVRHLRGRPVTPYLPPALVVPSATASSSVQPVTQVVSRPKRKRKARTDDTSRKLGPRSAPIVGYVPRTSGPHVESAPPDGDPPQASNPVNRGKPPRRPTNRKS